MGTLVGLYLAGLTFSLALAIALWRRDRSQLNLDLCAVWVAGTLSAIIQGALNQSPLLICYGFSSTVLTNLALGRLIARLAGLNLPLRRYLVLYLAGLIAAGLLAWAGAPFWATALPIALTAPFAALHAGILALRSSFSKLGTTGKAFIYTSFAFVAHNLDFPFLRDREEFASLGLVIALFLVWSLAPTAISAVLERTAEERGRLIEVEAQKSRFFANISHELRTPLTLILGPMQQLIGSEGSKPRLQTLNLVQRNAQRLLRMIDDLLDLSRMEAGKLKLEVSNADLAKLVRGACELITPAAAARQITLEMPSNNALSWAWLDAHRIEIIVGNLINNAVKYTQAGGLVRVELGGDADQARVVVSDNGPGIAPADHARVFERFVRVGAGQATTTGVGIGLALSRELAEAHGGSLRLESSLGKGSVFTLTLPRHALRAEARAVAREPGGLASELGADAHGAHSSLRSRAEPRASTSLLPAERGVSVSSDLPIRLEGGRIPQILIVEDEPDMRDFLVQVVSEQFECSTAQDGEEAWQLLQRFRPDLILTDVMMPGISGLELCARVKREAGLRAIPLMLLTARSGVEAAIEGYSVGADDFVSKPFHPRELMAHVRSHLTVRQLGLQLADQARLATSGTLAAGVAHEIRNPLNAALNALDILRDPELSASHDELLAIATDGMRRIQAVTEALNLHVRPAEDLSSRPCDVRECVEATLRLLQHRAERLSIHVELPAHVEILAPARAFSQTLLNLLDNALRAAKSSLWIKLTQEPHCVRLAIEDDGPGVPPALQSRIFDPFFTTREVGEGTGLGLHLSRGLAREAGGELRYEPKAGGGARFVLELPRLDQALAS
jgi:signal transduction histidine kinase